MRLRLVFLCLLVLALGSASAFAQLESARISGTVTDQQDHVVPGATVTATSTTTGVTRTTVTDGDGRFVIANLQPSSYELKFSLSGFKAVTMKLQVAVGAALTADAKLEVGGQTETVTVTAAPEIINTANAEVSTVVRAEQIQEMPNVERNPYSLVQLSGNAQDTPVEETLRNNAPRGVGFNVNGGRSAGTHILLDGSNNNYEFDTTVGQHIPLDSVQEFSVVTNNYSAQYGRSTGGVVNLITKSGTNQYTGSVYEYYRSDALATNTPANIANDVPKGSFKRNQPGYSFGGPIVKDKIHFFTNFEAINIASTDTQFSWVPTPQFLAASNQATRTYFATYDKGVQINGPILTRSAVSNIIDPTGAGSGAFSNLPGDLPVFGRVDKVLPVDAGGGTPQKDYQFVGRLDWSQGTATQMYVRYAFENSTTDPGTNSWNPYPGFDTGQHNNNQHVLGSVTHVYSPAMTSQTKVAYSRVLNEQPVNGPSSPRLVMNPNGPIALQGYNIAFPGYLPFQPANDIPAGGPQNQLQLYHDVTWLKGSHDIRFGGSYVRIADDHTFSAYSNAIQALNTTNGALTALDNFVTGNVLRFQAAINPGGYPGQTFTTPVSQPSFLSHNRYNEFSLYAQDNWGITNRMRLNLGIRYDYFGPQSKSDPKYDSNFYYGSAFTNLDLTTATPQQIIDAVRTGQALPSNQSPVGGLWANDWNNFGPHVGFAWDVFGDGRTSVRAGYGIGYERNFGNVTFNVLFNPPLYLVSTIDTGPNPGQLPSQPIYTDNAGPFAGSGVTKTIPPGSLRHVDQNIRTAYMHQYGASVQRDLGQGWVASVEYNGTTGRKLYDLADINKRGMPLIYEGIGDPCPAKGGSGCPRPNPQYTAFNTRGNRGQSQFDGVTMSLESRMLGKTGLSIQSHYTISTAKDNLSSTFSDGNNGYFNLGYLNPFDPMLDYGYSEYDVRNRLIVSTIWNMPFLQDATGMKRTLLGGWTMTGIFTARSGYPFTIFDCTNGLDVCMRAIDSANISRSATGSMPTGNPNEYLLLDLTPIMGTAGSYLNPLTGNSDYGPYPANMTKRDDFRGPGAWYLDFSIGKRFRFGTRQAFMFRFEAFNILNHANMLVNTQNADVQSFSSITGYKDGNRRAQLGFKFEF